jgi:hypothetical protein
MRPVGDVEDTTQPPVDDTNAGPSLSSIGCRAAAPLVGGADDEKVPVPPPPLTLAVADPAMTLPVGEPGWSYEMKVDLCARLQPVGEVVGRRSLPLSSRLALFVA